MKQLLSVLLACALLCGAALAETASPASCDITLAENTATGYLWSYSVSDETVLSVIDGGQAAGNVSLAGAPGTHSFSITGVGAGGASVTFTYSQPWEGGAAGDSFIYSFTVDENLGLTLTDTQGCPEEQTPDWIILTQYEDQATNQTWSYTTDADGVLQLEWDAYIAYAESADAAETGALCPGGLREWAFRAVGEGDVTITFTYISKNDNSMPEAAVSYEFTVGPDMVILPVAVEGDSGFIPETMRNVADLTAE